MFDLSFFTSVSSLFVIAYLGMFSHFLKQNVKGETATDIFHYFNDNFKSTFLAVVATFITTLGFIFTLKSGQAVDIVAVFGLGYCCDSLWNKWAPLDKV